MANKAQRESYKEYLDKIEANEKASRYWKAQNDLMAEIIRYEELLPKYQALTATPQEETENTTTDANTEG